MFRRSNDCYSDTHIFFNVLNLQPKLDIVRSSDFQASAMVKSIKMTFPGELKTQRSRERIHIE